MLLWHHSLDYANYFLFFQYYYSIRNIKVGGKCICNSHANECDRKVISVSYNYIRLVLKTSIDSTDLSIGCLYIGHAVGQNVALKMVRKPILYQTIFAAAQASYLGRFGTRVCSLNTFVCLCRLTWCLYHWKSSGLVNTTLLDLAIITWPPFNNFYWKTQIFCCQVLDLQGDIYKWCVYPSTSAEALLCMVFVQPNVELRVLA